MWRGAQRTRSAPTTSGFSPMPGRWRPPLRKRIVGVPELHYYDLYAPLVGSVKREYTPEEAQQIVLDAVAPLGPDYRTTIQRAFKERWIDLLPNEGKRSGAYSNGGAYDVHPYMLINFMGKYADVSTLAHELGHTMQSYFSNRTQRSEERRVGEGG